jgi:hypothetical protein
MAKVLSLRVVDDKVEYEVFNEDIFDAYLIEFVPMEECFEYEECVLECTPEVLEKRCREPFKEKSEDCLKDFKCHLVKLKEKENDLCFYYLCNNCNCIRKFIEGY